MNYDNEFFFKTIVYVGLFQKKENSECTMGKAWNEMSNYRQTVGKQLSKFIYAPEHFFQNSVSRTNIISLLVDSE